MGKIIGRALLGTLIVVVIAVVGLVAFIAWDLNTGEDATAYTNTVVQADDRTLNAYVAEPEGEGPFPAVLMIHEWWGLRPEIITKADALAEEGYVVMAIDAFRGHTSGAVPTAIYWNVNYPQEQIDADMDAFLDTLASFENVDAERIAVMGFCFGGRQSVQLAVRQPDRLDAVLTYYGGGQINTEDGLQPLEGNEINVLGVFGEDDGSIPLEDVEQFETALNALGVPNEISVYEDVGHAFVQELEGDSASARAWNEGVDFLDRMLGSDA